MRLLIRSFVLVLAALPLAALALLALSVQDRPLVSGVPQPAAHDIARAKGMFRSQDPRRGGRSGLRTFSVDEQDLSLVANYAASQLGQGAAIVAMHGGVATLQASVAAPANPFGRYLNVVAEFREAQAMPTLDRLSIGSLPVPRPIAERLLRVALRRLAVIDIDELSAMLQSVRFGDGRMTVVYRWSDEAAELARGVLVAPEDQQRLLAYQARLADTVARAPRALSLASLMPPLFGLAVQRGAAGDPLRENRAAIVVLALYVTGKPLDRLLTVQPGGPRPARRAVTLAGRTDFPMHFLVSAAIAAEAGSPLADAVGLHKEIEDARGGSGFSFGDVGANRAGTRFGEAAVQSPRRARELAQAVAAGVAEADLMPDVSDLPEFIADAEFRRRFGGVDGAGYEKLIATIEQRIDALPLLRR